MDNGKKQPLQVLLNGSSGNLSASSTMASTPSSQASLSPRAERQVGSRMTRVFVFVGTCFVFLYVLNMGGHSPLSVQMKFQIKESAKEFRKMPTIVGDGHVLTSAGTITGKVLEDVEEGGDGEEDDESESEDEEEEEEADEKETATADASSESEAADQEKKPEIPALVAGETEQEVTSDADQQAEPAPAPAEPEKKMTNRQRIRAERRKKQQQNKKEEPETFPATASDTTTVTTSDTAPVTADTPKEKAAEAAPPKPAKKESKPVVVVAPEVGHFTNKLTYDKDGNIVKPVLTEKERKKIGGTTPLYPWASSPNNLFPRKLPTKTRSELLVPYDLAAAEALPVAYGKKNDMSTIAGIQAQFEIGRKKYLEYLKQDYGDYVDKVFFFGPPNNRTSLGKNRFYSSPSSLDALIKDTSLYKGWPRFVQKMKIKILQVQLTMMNQNKQPSTTVGRFVHVCGGHR